MRPGTEPPGFFRRRHPLPTWFFPTVLTPSHEVDRLAFANDLRVSLYGTRLELATPSASGRHGGLPVPKFEFFRWASVEDTREGVSRYLSPHHLRLLADGDAVDVRMMAARFQDLVVTVIDYGAVAHVVPWLTVGYHPLIVPLRGRGTFHCGAEVIEAETGVGVLASPSQPLWMRLDKGAVAFVLRINEQAIGRVRASSAGYLPSESLVFDPVLDVREGDGLSWWNRVRSCLRSDYPGAGAVPGVEEMLIRELLSFQAYRVVPRAE
ncbi:hypothetical protein FCN18_24515 [Prauserella endophytica]|uniref:Transcription regulator HTH AraC- type ligand binding domain-containing protein n=1 Tax=Prauserella endophytica TaxID=1592324 RepID=A0ABY2RZA2_9PSEU|nr:hypothetical protein FCN18_24515 [Prauserella endophytica]